MIFYIPFLLLIFVGCPVVSLFVKNQKISRFLCCLIPCFLMFIFCSFKSINVGNDTIPYYEAYVRANGCSPLKFNKVGFEFIFSLLMIIFSSLRIPFTLFLVFCYAIIYSAIFYVVYKYSASPTFSFFIYVGFSFFAFNMSGLRQSLAISLLEYAVVILLSEKKKVPKYIHFYLIVLISWLIHESAFVGLFVPLLFMFKLNIKSMIVLDLFLIFSLFFVAPYTYEFLFYNIVGDRTYAPGSFGGGGLFFLLLLVFSFCIIFFDENLLSLSIDKLFQKIDNKFKKFDTKLFVPIAADASVNSLFVNMFLVGVAFQSFTRVNVNFPRFGFYFTIFLCPLFSNIVFNIKSKSLKAAVLLAFSCFYLAMFVYEYMYGNALGIGHYRFGFIN